MADGFWNRQQQVYPSAGISKRPRSEYDLPPLGAAYGHEMLGYLPRNDDHGGSRVLKDTKAIGSAYDRYLQSSQISSFSSGEASNFSGGPGHGRGFGGGMPSLPIGDPALMGGPGAVASDLAPNGRGRSFNDQLPVDLMARPGRETAPLPPDASSTLFVEGLPPDSTRREVAHIFRPFVGYKEVRLVNKEPKHRGGDPLVLCFVDFMNPACAATALSALQGPRSGSGPRSKR